MEFDSSMMQPKVVLEHCDISEHIKQETMDFKPRAKRKSDRKTKKIVTDNFNPWDVPNLEQFLVYSCPECDTYFKHNTRDTFIAHANDEHPKSRPFMFMFNLKQEEYLSNGFEDINNGNEEEDNFGDQKIDFDDIETEEITSEWDPSFESPSKRGKIEVDLKKEFEKSFEKGNESEPEYIKQESDYKPEIDESELEKPTDSCDSDYELEIRKRASKKPKSTNSKKVKCKQCNGEFKNYASMKSHFRIYHNTKERKSRKYFFATDPADGKQKFQCTECGLFCTQSNAMKHHLKTMHLYESDNELQNE